MIQQEYINTTMILYAYEAPSVEIIALKNALSLLVSISAQGAIEEWEEGEEL